jgi:hypothetical protein
VHGELDVGTGREFADLTRGFGPIVVWSEYERDRVRDFERQRLRLRSAHRHHHRRVQVGSVERTEGGDCLAHSGTTLGGGDGRPTEFDLDPGAAGADPHLEAAFCEY